MQLLLLSGGSGKRLWPLSNDVRSKQFLKVLKSPEGQSESMVQRVYRQIQEANIGASVTIASSSTQEESLRMQLGDEVNLVLEPERRDTFPAIALACTYLALEKGVSPDEVVIVLPVDVYADPAYFTTFLKMEEAILSNEAAIVLMGIEPRYPSEKYGYILPRSKTDPQLFAVDGFVEKPNRARAEQLLEKGAYWNGGVFAFKLGYLMENTAILDPVQSYQRRYDSYGKLKKTSFDYEVVERCSSLAMVPYRGNWKDLGSWDVLTTVLESPCLGYGILAEDQGNTHIVNELDVPVVALGTKNLIVAASHEGILVADLEHCSTLKQHVQDLTKTPRYEEHLWGTARVIDALTLADGSESRIKRLVIAAGTGTKPMVYERSPLLWVIVSGQGSCTIGDTTTKIGKGEVLTIPKGLEHHVFAETSLTVLEVPIAD